MIGKSKTGSSSQIICITLFSGRCYALLCLSKLCKNAGPKQFCWAKLACFGLYPIVISMVTYSAKLTEPQRRKMLLQTNTICQGNSMLQSATLFMQLKWRGIRNFVKEVYIPLPIWLSLGTYCHLSPWDSVFTECLKSLLPGAIHAAAWVLREAMIPSSEASSL